MPEGCGSYSDLAAENYDHFAAQPTASFKQQGGAGAWEAYEAGHEAACDFAKKHGASWVNEAIVMNGCASHFLSDLFAPGHQNNPRRAISAHAKRNWSPLSKTTKQFYSKWMHDEGNQAGLEFTNEANMKWRGYGDGCNEIPENKRNKEIQVMALTASVRLILETARDPNKYEQCIKNAEVKRLIPITSKLWDVEELKKNKDILPMFSSLMGPGTDINKGPFIKMRGHRRCKWFGADYEPFCNTQSTPAGINHGAAFWLSSGAGDWVDSDDVRRGGCTNKVTKNTFPTTQNVKSVCVEEEMHLKGVRHMKCTPNPKSSQVVCKSRSMPVVEEWREGPWY